MNVADVKKVEVNGSLSFVTVTGYTAFGGCVMATKLTKYGPAKMNNDIIMAENNYQMFLNAWEKNVCEITYQKVIQSHAFDAEEALV